MVRRNARRVVLALTIGALIGLVVTLCLPSGAQTSGTGWQDKTFALAQHPAAGIGGPGGGAWLPFASDGTIWDGDSTGRRALVSVACTNGTLSVHWDGSTIGLGKGDTTTVFASFVNVDCGRPGSGVYMITVDVTM